MKWVFCKLVLWVIRMSRKTVVIINVLMLLTIWTLALSERFPRSINEVFYGLFFSIIGVVLCTITLIVINFFIRYVGIYFYEIYKGKVKGYQNKEGKKILAAVFSTLFCWLCMYLGMTSSRNMDTLFFSCFVISAFISFYTTWILAVPAVFRHWASYVNSKYK